MGLFSKVVREIKIDYYGQKKRHKVISDVQLYYYVSMSQGPMDPVSLADMFAKAFVCLSDIPIMPGDRDVFWTYVNDSFSRILASPSSILAVWPGFIDLAPLPGQVGNKPVVNITLSLMDNGKVKYKITENTVTAYYNTIAPVAIMQTLISMMDQNQFAAFYQRFNQLMVQEKQTSKRPDMLGFNLESLPMM